jgi:hypothetical protein
VLEAAHSDLKQEKNTMSISIVSQIASFFGRKVPIERLCCPPFTRQNHHLPHFVRESTVAMCYLDLLGVLDWSQFPERNLHINKGRPPTPHAPFVAACLIKLDQGLTHMSQLRNYLVQNPALVWLLGFPLLPSKHFSWGFDAQVSIPTQRHCTRLLREVSNTDLQTLLDASIRLLRSELAGLPFGECISLDTKHILAWVQENNPKAYIEEGRFKKDRQPAGDPDCKLGCKRKHNRSVTQKPSPTPSTNPVPASSVEVGEYYWGYASGVVATKVADWGEFVLAEMTQTFDKSDVSYFFPLISQVEQRLDGKPRWGAFDAAFDAFYVYAYFHRQEDPYAFAAIPFSEKGGYKAKGRLFAPNGLPLCAAEMPMPLQFTYIDRTVTIIEHERGKYVCPLRFPVVTSDVCPVNHNNWSKGGCTAMMPTSIGARLRYQLDRDSQEYKAIYRQRTAIERINSQATELGIERPHIRNGQAIANINTLIYVLINLRTLHRIRQRKVNPTD